ncbi:KTSC domain-containing protein [Pedobacter sp. UBA4863]|uniref:KTSC domain-containing protein n=1 Tax=Pedobacter sp. UBA4863 TaxID=1947060 RepID=UPI0025FEAEC3|nr:KTSC domain-containing protein [Pedobacter sp. UBA4863]
MKLMLLIIVFSLTLYSLNAQNCKDIPQAFSNYRSASATIQTAKFLFLDNINTPKSSWIKSASFKSCDRKKGYLIIYLKNNNTYIHQNLPTNIWNNFKKANSKGSYYTKNIKKRYKLRINN